MKKYTPLLAVVSIACFAAVIYYSNPSTFLPILYASDFRYLAAGIAVMTVGTYFRVMKWGSLLPRKISTAKLAPVQLVGINASNFSPGKVAEPVKTLLLKSKYNIPVSETLPSVIWERIIDLVVMIFFSIVLIFSLSLSKDLLYFGFLCMALFIVAISLAVVALKKRSFGERLVKLVKFLPLLKKIDSNFLQNFYNVKLSRSGMIKCVVFTTVAWFLDGVVFYLAFLSVGITLNPLLLAGIVSFSMLIGVASFLPGGLGSTEIVMMVLFGILGITNSVAFAGMILARLMTFWYVALLGGASVMFIGKADANR
jgi:uncharacterized protein (TIRG00374 family)